MIKNLAKLYNDLKVSGRVVEAERLLDMMVEAGLGDVDSERADWTTYANPHDEDDHKDHRTQELAPKARRSFRVPSPGLTSVRNLNKRFKTTEPETADQFDWERATVPTPGTWNQNNGTIAICDNKGKIHCWVYNGLKSRTHDYQKTMDAILDAGFTQLQFYVPFSN